MTALVVLKFHDNGQDYYYAQDCWPGIQLPFQFRKEFCYCTSNFSWTYSPEWNFWVHGECGKPRQQLWALFIFECDGCESLFLHKPYPIKLELCSECGA